jgi:hypothetical protein
MATKIQRLRIARALAQLREVSSTWRHIANRSEGARASFARRKATCRNIPDDLPRRRVVFARMVRTDGEAHAEIPDPKAALEQVAMPM